MLRFFVAFLLFLSVDMSPLHDERRQIIERVRSHLRESDDGSDVLKDFNWVPNSNKIGIGYNIFSGSPVCFTGACQMDQFNHPVFKLNYSSAVPGSCTDKLVPDNVYLDCLPSGAQTIDSEVIETVENVHSSIAKKVEVSVGVQYKGLAFSYSHSRETKQILDSLYEKKEVNIRNSVQISYVKLSMFTPKMELSDNFRYVIDNMFCCEDNDPDIDEYVKEFIFDYFGLTYVNTILLGGEAQQTIFMSQEKRESLEQKQIHVSHQASLAFSLSTGLNTGIQSNVTVSTLENDSNYQSFKNATTSIKINTFGGTSGLTNFTEWSTTVPRNPVIIQFKVQDIFRLLTNNYFPNDLMITNKSLLIENVLNRYLNNSVFCYTNCGANNSHGICESTGYLQFGKCKCYPGWTGANCETPYEESNEILDGTICGLDRSFIKINCGGFRPWTACPTGWLQKNWKTDLTICYKDKTAIGLPVHGTLCGLHSYNQSYNFNLNVGCNNTSSVLTKVCPTGYEIRDAGSQSCLVSPCAQSIRNAACVVINSNKTLPGTLCGMQIEDSVDGPTCAGYNPGLRQCPPKYNLHRTAFNDYGFMVCVKQ